MAADANVRRRRGLTLIELLITVLIISILAAAVLGVAAIAGETAREARTRDMVARLHTLLMDHYESYKHRRIKLHPDVLRDIDSLSDTRQRGQARAEARLYALREMMLTEIPDRWSDVILAPLGVSPEDFGNFQFLEPPGVSAGSNVARTPLGQVYLRHYLRLQSQGVDAPTLRENQGAELLYLIVTTACADGQARSLFNESSVGDTDGDGAREFLDGWGRPIHFLRWAPGFDSEVQLNANLLGSGDPPQPPDQNNTNTEWLDAANDDHDPYDLFRIEPAAFRLVPLIYSAGRDEELGIYDAKDYRTWVPPSTPPAGTYLPTGYGKLSPYYPVTGAYLGTSLDRSVSTDNIHNHLLGER